MLSVRTAVTVSSILLAGLPAYAQTGARPIAPPAAPPAASPVASPVQAPATAATPAAGTSAASGVTPPPGYVIGPDDVLDVNIREDKDSSSKDVPVGPDGKVHLTLLNELQAAGLTPEQFRVEVVKAATKYFTDPTVSISVKQINSRRVYISGNIAKAGAYPLGQPITVFQLISMAGGLQEYAKGKAIIIVRDGKDTPFHFNYDEFQKGKNLKQDIQLMPGDRVIVP
jgi:polysaccharide export outer membrane protein